MPYIDSDRKIKAFILHKLSKHGYWGGRHTSFDNLQKGLPPHLRGEARNIGKELIRDSFLLAKPTSYGLEVSLNPSRRQEIEEFIDENLF